MLKRRIGSVVLAASMLAGMYVLPASAKTKEYQESPITKTVIYETFDGCANGETFGKNTMENPVAVTGANENTEVTTYNAWGNAPVTIEDGAALMNFNDGAKLNIRSKNGGIRVKDGDVIKVSFKFKCANTAKGEAPIIVNLNDRKKTGENGTMCRFLRQELSPADAHVASYPTQANFDPDKNHDGRIFNLFTGIPNYSMHGGRNGWFPAGTVYSKTEWNLVTITINTSDSSSTYNGEQTLRAEVRYTENGEEKSTYFKGLYDADYTGDGDEIYNKFTEISSIQLDSLASQENATATFDDIKVELETTERTLTSVKSDLDGIIIHETFDGCTPETSFGTNKVTTPESVTGADENTTIQVYKNWSTVPLVIQSEGAGNHIASMNFGNGAKLNIQNKNGSTEVKKGDIIKVSFKFKSDYTASNPASMIVNLNDSKKSGDTGQMSRYTKKEGILGQYSYQQNGTLSYPADTITIGPNTYTPTDTSNDGRILNLFLGKPYYSMNSVWDKVYQAYTMNPYSTIDWNFVTITINTADPAYEGEQTLKAEVTYTENGEEKSTYFKGLYDANYTGEGDTVYDKFTEINSVQIDSLREQYTPTAAFDDIKVQVITPTFEIWGAATAVDGIDGALDDEFIQGKNLTVKAVTPKKDALLLVGIYDKSGELVACKMVQAGNDGNIVEKTGIDTTGAETIKLFLWDNSSITPYIESKTLTRYTEGGSSGND